MEMKDVLFRMLRKGFRFIFKKKFLPPECDCDRQSSNDIIYKLLASGNPCLIARFGTTEINTINNYLCVHSNKPFLKKCIEYIIDNTHTPWWNTNHFHTMSIYSGIFPEGQDTAERFSERYLQDIPEIDLLACHQYYEKFMPLRADIQRIQLEMLYPFFVERSWSRILKGKKVLVIHPFEESIKAQYAKRDLLFDNPDILPEFELITMKAVQTVAGNKSEFKDWFEALAYMEDQVSSVNFDIAIIGCGAYGLPLAAHVKRLGKQAVHLAGGTQLLFGIIGNRWTETYKKIGVWHYLPGYDINIDYTPLFNEKWIYPLPSDTPKNTQAVEGSCYWK